MEHSWWVQVLVGGTGIGGGFAIFYQLIARLLSHKEKTRAQSDTVALDLVATQTNQIEQLLLRIEGLVNQRQADREASDAREALCEAKLENVRHEHRNLEGAFDGLLQTLRFAQPERFPEVIAETIEARRTRRADRAGEDHNLQQRIQSGGRVARDKMAAAG